MPAHTRLSMQIEPLDHFVLTVRDIDATIRFYERVMGMQAIAFGSGRRALGFGQSKINLHPADAPIAPHATRPTPGSADLCFICATSLDEGVSQLLNLGVPAQAGPVPRTGALGSVTSLYFRDPDDNRIEVSHCA